MKSLVAALGAALIASAVAAATPTPPPPKPANIDWVFTIMKQEGNLLSVKVRNDIPAGAQPAAFPNAIEMHWKYPPDDKGLPSEKVLTQIAKMEATLDPIQGDKVGFLMMIVTGKGERTWLWYVADPKAFGAALNRLIPGHPFPITLNATGKDPDWTTYRAMREKVK
jgi:Family of unknown function (DUF695)